MGEIRCCGESGGGGARRMTSECLFVEDGRWGFLAREIVMGRARS